MHAKVLMEEYLMNENLLRRVRGLGLREELVKELEQDEGMRPIALVIGRDEKGNYYVRAHIFLFGMPDWEIGEDRWEKATVEKLIEILPEMGRNIHERITRVTNQLEALRNQGYSKYISPITYGISIRTTPESPEEAVKEAEKLISILSCETKSRLG
jgi:hypothetical protein